MFSNLKINSSSLFGGNNNGSGSDKNSIAGGGTLVSSQSSDDKGGGGGMTRNVSFSTLEIREYGIQLGELIFFFLSFLYFLLRFPLFWAYLSVSIETRKYIYHRYRERDKFPAVPCAIWYRTSNASRLTRASPTLPPSPPPIHPFLLPNE